MVNLTDLFSLDDFDQAIKDGNVRRQTHPTAPLAIVNYTEHCQFSRAWTDVTLSCRGLIYNTETFDVVARPWKKFFNLDDAQVPYIPTGPMMKAPKMDGSLGILYKNVPTDRMFAGRYSIASRGSFASEHAVRGTQMFLTTGVRHGFVPLSGHTYLFEIIWPENRIVVDYGDFEGLVLLDVLDNETGQPNIRAFDDAAWPHKVIKTVIPSFEHTIANEIGPNEEGFVLYWPYQDLRVKLKGDEYVRLHRILTNCTARTVWEYLSTGRPWDDLVEKVPDEFYDWLQQIVGELTGRFEEIRKACEGRFRTVMNDHHLWHRFDREAKKEFALAVKDDEYKAILFSMWDDRGKEHIDALIWKLIKPAHEKPFRNGEK